MDGASSGFRRGGRPSRPGQLWRPQPGRGASAPQSAGGRQGNSLPDVSQRVGDNAAEYRVISATDTSGPSFTPQDARSSGSSHVPSAAPMMPRRESDGSYRQEDPAISDRDRSDRIGDANAIVSYQHGGSSGDNRARRNHGRRDARMDRHPENLSSRLMGNRPMGVLDSSLENPSTGMHLHNGHEFVSTEVTLSQQDFIEEPSSRTLNSPDFIRSQNPRVGYARQHLPASGSRRQQWRPTSSQNVRLGNNDEAANRGVLTSQEVEASRGAVDEVLQSLSLHRSGGRALNKAADTHRNRSNQRHPRGRLENVNQDHKFMTEYVPRDKTNIPQLVQELEEKLSKGQVECMICYDMVKREAAVWSCGGCYAIFHIACIRRWARAPISADFSISSSNEVTVGNWRCPGCQSPQFISAEDIKYRCFCGQMVEPQVDYYLTPHSCGGPCKKSLSSLKSPHCKHICTMQCHPGPCPPCNALAPPQFCPCGKSSYTQRCSELKSAKSCGQVCGHQLECGRHYCQKICHEGPCGSCDTLLTVNCFCGKRRQTMACGGMGLQGELEWENGVFSCASPCLNKLQCGKHSCNRKCHPGQCGECELAPGKVRTCPCGKTSVQELLGMGRRRDSCTDPVPHCGQVCEKLLPCGKHACLSLCHTGDCPVCEVLVDQKCRCKLSSQTMPCHQAMISDRDGRETLGDESAGGLFLCSRICGKKKSCGRHRCNNKCCPLANNDDVLLLGEEDPHLCSLPCGKKLRCGQHTCDELCHNGHCPPCLGSTFTELSCACGRTSIPPPVPCGTFPPSCPHPCSRAQPCGHAATHQCHFGECPPCIVLTAKECVGGHVVLRNVPCGSKDIKCNKLCGKVRQCRLHACARLCHLSPCEEIVDPGDNKVASCGQQCGAPRRDCQHVCVAPCHPSSPCPETRCKFPVTITCSCGRLTQQVLCDAGECYKGSDMLELAYISSLPLQPVDGKTRVPLGQRKLACDEECAKLEKKRVLADAFGMTGVPVDPALSAESVQAASDALKELLIRDPQWILAIEDRFKYLVLGAKSNAAPIRVHVFGFLPKEKRDVIKQLAERWNLTVNAVGREPKRFLTVHVNSKSRAPHMRLLFGRSPLPPPGQAQAQAYNPSLDMDPRFVVGLFELPREGDISTLVLRFGGECELVWLNDKNALAVFFDMMRAATAVRRVDHASTYTGALRISSVATASSNVKGWGTSEAATTSKAPSRKKNMQESTWSEDAWGEEWGRWEARTALDNKGPPISTSVNPWGALAHDEAAQKTSAQGVEKPIIPPRTTELLRSATTRDAAESWEDLDS
ncbi:hypothetical protein GOP47_0027899 [Adiantum capillus-veneris]|nr:hypothetical protein GOP47_0027899 [Adiantum capillus-veneris]